MKKKVLALLLSVSMAVGITAFSIEGMKVNTVASPLEKTAENTRDNPEDDSGQSSENLEDWYWTEQEDGTVLLSSYRGTATQVEIPSMVDGQEVTGIGYQAFYGNEFMTSITIPDTVKIIQEEAFAYCSSLSHITLPKGLVSLENDTFYCAGLERIALPESLEKIGENTFAGCGNLQSIEIPDQVERIGSNAFSCCDKLESVRLSNSLQEIGEGAFEGCENLRGIEIPNQVVNIGDRTFYSCDRLESVTLLDSLEEIGESAFSYCANLRKMVLPNSLTRIGNRAFENCLCLIEISIPENVTAVESDAFLGCSALEQIDVAEGNAAFCSLDGVLFNKAKTELLRFPEGKYIEKYEIPPSVQKIGDYAFGAEETTTDISVSIPDTVQEIGAYAFCSYGAGDIKLPKDLKSIGDYAFAYAGCGEMEIPSGVTYIGEGAFSDNYNLISINVDTANPSFCSQDGILFNKAKTELAAYPGGITGKKYSVPSGVESILPSAFSGNENLKEVLLPKSVSKVGLYAFKNMELTEAVILNLQCLIGEESGDEESGYDEVFSPGVKVCGYEDSTAQAYAQKYAIPFKAITGEVCEHEYKGTVTTPSTCVQKGIKTFTCSKCKDSYTEELPLAGHEYTGQVTIPSTCVQKGIKTFTCSICKDSYTEELPLGSHTYIEQVTRPATCSQKGVKEYTCSVCRDSYTEEMPAVGHDYQTVTVKATTSKDGSIQKQCRFCGDVSEAVPIAYPRTITLAKSSVIYTGKVQRVSVQVKDSAGRAVSPANYSVSYNGNKNVGEATVTINFKGNYTGSVKKTFRILPKSTSLSKVSAKSKGFLAKWKKQAAQTDGYQIQYSTNSKFKGKDAKTISIKRSGATSMSISKLKARKKYYVRIRTYKTVKIKGKNVTLCSGWSKAKAITTKK